MRCLMLPLLVAAVLVAGCGDTVESDGAGSEPAAATPEAAATPNASGYAVTYRDAAGDVAHSDATPEPSRPDLDMRTVKATVGGGQLRVAITFAEPARDGTSVQLQTQAFDTVVAHVGESEAQVAADDLPVQTGTVEHDGRRVTVTVPTGEFSARPRQLQVRTQDPDVYLQTDGEDSLWDYAPGGAMTADQSASKYLKLRRTG